MEGTCVALCILSLEGGRPARSVNLRGAPHHETGAVLDDAIPPIPLLSLAIRLYCAMGSKASKPVAPAERAKTTTASFNAAVNDAHVLANKKRSRSNVNDTTTSKRTKHNSNLQTSSWSRPLAEETDKDNLNEYSCFVREQLELFSLSQEEVDHIRETNLTKYKRGGSCLVAGQVGLRCKHCQQKTSFPGNLSSVCGASMMFVGNHFIKGCREMNDESSKKLLELKRSFGGKGGHGAKSKGRYSAAAKRKGPYSAAKYVAKCLQDVGIENVPDGAGIFLRH